MLLWRLMQSRTAIPQAPSSEGEPRQPVILPDESRFNVDI
ncbi:hypothetical protein OHAE_2541 [Ochrobactrum soli]|uniref:Uncharacterized protein n=1 Tax=Ochrobactrum soli TaxID=2448455 RepID=A0A2P9HRA9_9HYPH|nr:hypothetical protein OHAE_2541 [[Ochrobactrum] soli]